MLFALTCLDKPGALPIRLENRPAHLEYLNGSGKVAFGGPFIEAGQPIGSLLVIEAADRAEAEAFAAADPYARAGLFESVTIREWRKVIG
ncbi:MAG: YciI family protein [Gemmobacter sp.]|nr:YciI family protein [Gemmobacter sp.]